MYGAFLIAHVKNMFVDICLRYASVYFSRVCMFDPYKYHTDLCKESFSSGQPTGQPSVLHDNIFNVGHYTQAVQPFFSYLQYLQVLLTSTILDHFS